MGDGWDEVLAGQQAYYRARAPEYDQVYAGRAFQELTGIVGRLPISGDVLELACGTGQWTSRLAHRAARYTALDGAPEMLRIARQRTRQPVEWVQADLWTWQPARRYDTVFFAFWLSHVPPERFAGFWKTLEGAVAPGGRVVFVDTDAAERATERVTGQGRPTVLRKLDDGTEHEIVKLFHRPEDLAADLRKLGWIAQVDPADGGFISGVATLTDRSARD